MSLSFSFVASAFSLLTRKRDTKVSVSHCITLSSKLNTFFSLIKYLLTVFYVVNVSINEHGIIYLLF